MAKQQVRDEVLYRSPEIKGPQTELRRTGDNLILYTQDNEIYQRFRQWSQLKFVAPYYQGYMFSAKDRRLVAAELYFPLAALSLLRRALNGGKVADLSKEAVFQAH